MADRQRRLDFVEVKCNVIPSLHLIMPHAVWTSVGIAPLIVTVALHVDGRLASCSTVLLLAIQALVLPD
jgi:hypothetical protein